MPAAPKAADADTGVDTSAITYPEELGLSKQAQFSTYKEDPDAPADANPPDGPHVIQELGKPKAS